MVLPTTTWLLLLLIGVAAYTDLTQRKIFNATTYPIWCAALLLGAAVSLCREFGLDSTWIGPLSLSQAALGSLGSGAVMLVPYALSRGGAGDVKLAAAMGGLLGLEPTLWALGIAYIAAAGWIVLDAILQRGFAPVAWVLARPIQHGLIPAVSAHYTATRSSAPRRTVPLAGFFALGAIVVVAGAI